MKKSNVIKTEWNASRKLIVTQMCGDMDETDIIIWEQSLAKALLQIMDNDTFKIFVNFYGFVAADIASHKKFRGIIPLTLASYGWKVGYVNLFEEAASIRIQTNRGIRCLYAVHVHHDVTKMEKYETLFGRKNEHFFADPEKAETWINSIPI